MFHVKQKKSRAGSYLIIYTLIIQAFFHGWTQRFAVKQTAVFHVKQNFPFCGTNVFHVKHSENPSISRVRNADRQCQTIVALLLLNGSADTGIHHHADRAVERV